MSKAILPTSNIELNVQLASKEDAIRYTGNILVNNGYVEASYIDKMLEREEMTSTFIGNSVAIPHGTDEAKAAVLHTGLAIVTVPDGVDFNGNTVRVLIGIAGKGDEHLEILSNIAIVCSEESNIETIVNSTSKEDVIALFSEVTE
ncbi:PTS sugar transporter subunit IIA [Aureibacillus halotolerans]|uniref:Mannitol-specific phosphotransferase enzyme IIA component n=1 Tax=Aureibacillus halotolerans TaxID=1508390 RepID=A0A4R6TVD6_9BACI|nr:PTS sugar transporter subunit IIA [Aureibacillus halotolerans]TDQ37748.1 PTS system D-mannitol-specific IIA component (Fru family) [Aureibacillus halotolerans]